MEKELIERNLLLSKISGRYDEKHDIVPDNLAEGFVQVEKLIKEQPVAFKIDEMLNYLADQKAHNESMYLSAAENKDKYSEARYAGKMDAYRDIFDMMKKMKLE